MTCNLWRPMSEAPTDGTEILAVAVGLDNRPLRAIVHWSCRVHMFDSRCPRCVEGEHKPRRKKQCKFEWIGPVGLAYGVEFVAWMHLPDWEVPKRYVRSV